MLRKFDINRRGRFFYLEDCNPDLLEKLKRNDPTFIGIDFRCKSANYPEWILPMMDLVFDALKNNTHVYYMGFYDAKIPLNVLEKIKKLMKNRKTSTTIDISCFNYWDKNEMRKNEELYEIIKSNCVTHAIVDLEYSMNLDLSFKRYDFLIEAVIENYSLKTLSLNMPVKNQVLPTNSTIDFKVKIIELMGALSRSEVTELYIRKVSNDKALFDAMITGIEKNPKIQNFYFDPMVALQTEFFIECAHMLAKNKRITGFTLRSEFEASYKKKETLLNPSKAFLDLVQSKNYMKKININWCFFKKEELEYIFKQLQIRYVENISFDFFPPIHDCPFYSDIGPETFSILKEFIHSDTSGNTRITGLKLRLNKNHFEGLIALLIEKKVAEFEAHLTLDMDKKTEPMDHLIEMKNNMYCFAVEHFIDLIKLKWEKQAKILYHALIGETNRQITPKYFNQLLIEYELGKCKKEIDDFFSKKINHEWSDSKILDVSNSIGKISMHLKIMLGETGLHNFRRMVDKVKRIDFLELDPEFLQKISLEKEKNYMFYFPICINIAFKKIEALMKTRLTKLLLSRFMNAINQKIDLDNFTFKYIDWTYMYNEIQKIVTQEAESFALGEKMVLKKIQKMLGLKGKNSIFLTEQTIRQLFFYIKNNTVEDLEEKQGVGCSALAPPPQKIQKKSPIFAPVPEKIPIIATKKESTMPVWEKEKIYCKAPWLRMPADGDCLFNAVLAGVRLLDAGNVQFQAYTAQSLRTEFYNYIKRLEVSKAEFDKRKMDAYQDDLLVCLIDKITMQENFPDESVLGWGWPLKEWVLNNRAIYHQELVTEENKKKFLNEIRSKKQYYFPLYVNMMQDSKNKAGGGEWEFAFLSKLFQIRITFTAYSRVFDCENPIGEIKLLYDGKGCDYHLDSVERYAQSSFPIRP